MNAPSQLYQNEEEDVQRKTIHNHNPGPLSRQTHVPEGETVTYIPIRYTHLYFK